MDDHRTRENDQQNSYYGYDVEEFKNTELGENRELDTKRTSLIERLKREKGIGVIFASLLFVLGKFKFLILILSKFKFLLVLLKLGKFAATLGSMFIMVIVYAKLYTWAFGIGFVLLIFIHEMGHYLMAKKIKLPVSMPLFIPFVGAFIKMKEQPENATAEAKVAIGGPLLGSFGALLCLRLYSATNRDFFLALAYIGFMLNLFNLIPIYPLDGGRIVSAISPKIWLIGIPLMLIAAIKFYNPIIIIFLILGIAQAYHQWKKPDKKYFQTDIKTKMVFSIAYFSMVILLGIGMVYINSIHGNLSL